MSMRSRHDGAGSRVQHGSSVAGLLAMPATLAATPESIHWTQTLHERSVTERHDRIAIAAYLRSEARGFEPGHEAEDWLAAQTQIDAIAAGSFET